jgi:hypothetical protein
MKPLTYDRGYDNVLLGQGYRTPRGAVMDEYGAVVELLAEQNQRTRRETCSNAALIRNKNPTFRRPCLSVLMEG